MLDIFLEFWDNRCMTPVTLLPLTDDVHDCNLDIKIMIPRQYIYAECLDCGEVFEQFS